MKGLFSCGIHSTFGCLNTTNEGEKSKNKMDEIKEHDLSEKG
jgi:hypothetical protein